jgi:glutamyl-tRNA synthetase
MRVEDLDRQRVKPGLEEQQLADLRAIGIDWDGEVVRQSDRLDLYADAIESLDAAGLTYPCWCTRAEIREAASAAHGPLPEGAYPGTCRHLSARERADREASGRPPALRIRAGGERVEFHDRLLGDQAGSVDDFVLRRGDGTPAYNLAVVVDDAAQGVGEVVRGADLVDSTPRQILLGRLLGLPEPGYAHVPLVLGPDGSRLAKRHGAVTLADRARLGQAPADVLGWMAASVRLAEPGEPVSAAELVDRFDPAQLPRVPTTVDPAPG